LNRQRLWVNRRRYLQIGGFWASLLAHLLWWDLFFALPVLRWLQPAREERWQQLAQRYCCLAAAVGGLWIKLGQFLSLRVDLFPRSVIQELELLRDQAPAAPYVEVVPQVEAELGASLPELFAWFSPEPVASASVAQVHRAQLHSGQQVVVKVLRPGTPDQFAMDLELMAFCVRGLGLLPPVRHSFDLERMLAEFTEVTRRELDMCVEAANAERFARAAVNNPMLYIPAVHLRYSGRCVLTMEDATYLRLNNLAEIDAAGIDRQQIAQQLAQLILEQIFVLNFVHADPHPGNFFLRPLPGPEERREPFAPREPVPYRRNRMFQIVLIDFGMAVAIPPEQQAWLREFLIGLGLRDAKRIVQAYQRGGLLRAGADVRRVEAMTVDLLDGYQGLLVGLMPDFDDPRTQQLFEKHGALLTYEYPFQIPMDLLFMYRAMGTLGGVIGSLDREFDLSSAAMPFALQFFWQKWQQEMLERSEAVAMIGQLLLQNPVPVSEVLMLAQRTLQPPELVDQFLLQPWRERSVQAELSHLDRDALRQLDRSVRAIRRTLVALGFGLAGILLLTTDLSHSDLLRTLVELASEYGTLLAGAVLLWLGWQTVRGG
jgi:predicted unusual protein kinase regulating ubiquinone biosynthesis (AarF/ABC1/UbiB family)